MKWRQRAALITACVTGMGVSFIYHLLKDVDIVGEIKAPVHVNIEIDKTYMRFISVVATLNGGNALYLLSPTTNTGNPTRTVVMYTEIKQGRETPFVHALFFRIPKDAAAETLGAIEGTGVFIGNKAFYFSRADIAGLGAVEQDGYLLYALPGLEYQKSFLGRWINWYGDFNLVVKTFLAFFIHPEKFVLTWIFIICFLIICRTTIANIYCFLGKQNVLLSGFLPLAAIFVFGFILSLNGYVRYSLWRDELYSACIASNPARSVLTTFEDPGNPPFYFILLRFWFMVFGWTEQSGRLLSAVLGGAAVVSLYILVQFFAGRKAALMAAVFMAVNTYLTGFSREMRGYILEVFLVSVVALRLLIFTRKGGRTFVNLMWYVVPSVLLVNTHYYGVLLIITNFSFFIAVSLKTKTFIWKKTILFFAGNVFIALSLLPFFIYTALRKTLLDVDFNAWIQKPGFMWKCLAALALFLALLYARLRKTVFQKIMSGSRRYLLDYALFAQTAVFLLAFGFSLYRPILREKYLVILFPFLLVTAAVVFAGILENVSSKSIAGLCAACVYICILTGYEAKSGDETGAYKESHVFMSRDAESRAQNKTVELIPGRFFPAERFLGYSYKQLPLYNPGDIYDVLFFHPEHRTEVEAYSDLAKFGIRADHALQIRVNETSSVFKIYP
jgi:4-amino-4-deoxy-L-arabinose transferase-like glycosyltransferase